MFFVGEQYFFDKLFYRKSTLHGYYDNRRPWKNPLYQFISFTIGPINDDLYRDKPFIPKQADEYLIIISGDSNVWGTGVRVSQRFTNILEKKLNAYRKTRVISLGKGNTGFAFHLAELEKYVSSLKPDLVIQTFYENDLVLNQHEASKLEKYFWHNKDTIIFYNEKDIQANYSQKVLHSYDSKTINYEIFQYFLPKLNKDDLYFLLHYFPLTEHEILIENALQSQGLRVVDNQDLLKSKYEELMATNNEKLNPTLEISAMEGHPNPIAHQMFAETLYREIITNPGYHFLE